MDFAMYTFYFQRESHCKPLPPSCNNKLSIIILSPKCTFCSSMNNNNNNSNNNNNNNNDNNKTGQLD